MKKIIFGILALFSSQLLYAQTSSSTRTTIDNNILNQGVRGITAAKTRTAVTAVVDYVDAVAVARVRKDSLTLGPQLTKLNTWGDGRYGRLGSLNNFTGINNFSDEVNFNGFTFAKNINYKSTHPTTGHYTNYIISNDNLYSDGSLTISSNKFTGGAVSTTTNFRIKDNNVAIGSTSFTPTANFHLNGTFRYQNGSEGANKIMQSDANGNVLWVTAPFANLNTANTFANNITINGNLSLPIGNFNSDGNINSNGNLYAVQLRLQNGNQGANKFIVSDASGNFDWTNRFLNKSTVHFNGTDVTSSFGQLAMVEFTDNTGVAGSVGFTGSRDFEVISAKNRDLRLGTNNTLHVTIKPSGNVGIGETSPTSKLQVAGLPVYASNSAAITGGLTAGAFYRTSTGQLMVVY